MTRPSIESLFSSFKRFKNLEKNNLLLKSGDSVQDAWAYLQDVDVDYTVIEQVRNYDYKKIFSSNPTQLDRKQEEQFKASKSALDASNKPVVEEHHNIFKPTPLVLDIEDSQENIQNFLLRKVKRHRPSKNGEKLPENIQELIKNYGDVCSNITHDMMRKYQFYQRFYSFS
jgi:hypothetical protein